jgi:hypothetical protein
MRGLNWRAAVERGCVQVCQTVVQGRGRDIGVGQSVHRGKVLSRHIATERTAWGAGATARARCAIPVGVEFAVQLIEGVLAVKRRCLVCKVVHRNASSLRGLPYKVIVLIDGEVWRNKDRDWEGSPQLQ